MSGKLHVGKVETVTLGQLLAEWKAKLPAPRMAVEFPQEGIVTLQFRADTQDARRAMKASALCSTLWLHSEFLREVLKREKLTKHARRALEDVQRHLLETMDDNGVRLEELWT